MPLAAADVKEYCPHTLDIGENLRQPPALEQSLEAIEWMLFHVDQTESAEFVQALAEFHRRATEGDGPVVAEFRAWWTSWIISLRLNSDSDYQRKVKESLARHGERDVGIPVGAEDLRDRLLK